MKRLISQVLCAVLLLSLAGCAQVMPAPQTEPPTEPTEPPTQPVVEVTMEDEKAERLYEDVELEYWTMLSEQDPEAAVLQQAAAVFEQTTGAKVNLNWMADGQEELELILSGDVRVDLFEVTGDALEQGLVQYALALTDLADAADYSEKSWEVLRKQILDRFGELKAVALRPHLYGMYYNQDRFDDLGIDATPGTWEEYITFCQMLKDEGYEALAIDQERANLLLELHMERALGWEDLKETMVYARWWQNEMARTVVQAAIQFAEDGYVVKGTPDTYPEGQNRLIQSNAMLVAGSERLCAEVEQSTMMQANWGVFPYPGDGPGTGLLVDADLLAVSSSCTEPEAAFDFAMLLAIGEFDQLRADIVKGIPADPANTSPINGANICMADATPHGPKWFVEEQNLLFTRLWNGWYKTGSYFIEQLNGLSRNFAHEKSVG